MGSQKLKAKKEIEFVKTVASGNDFIIIDTLAVGHTRLSRNALRAPGKPCDTSYHKTSLGDTKYFTRLAKELCHRKMSVGADGLLLLEPSRKADFKMRIFNPDGSEVDMCGNGTRCVALYADKNKIVLGGQMLIETRAGNLKAEVKRDTVRVRMPRPKDLRLRFSLDIAGKRQNVSFINTGVPHTVCFVQGLDNFNVKETGKTIRGHPEFQPGGTNADFVEVLNKQHIRLRTYERGVEEETLACGTGCVASAIIAVYDREKEPQGRYKVCVDTKSGQVLTIYFRIEKGNIDEVYLEGAARVVYKGLIEKR